MLKRLACIAAAALVLLCLPAYAEEKPEIKLEIGEWSWTAGEASEFSGTVIGEAGTLKDAVIRLSIKAEPELDDQGEVLFSTVNGKRLKVRAQKDYYEIGDKAAEGSISFTGNWHLPEDGYFREAALTITLENSDGSTITSLEETVMNPGWTDSSTDQPFHIPIDIDQLLLILAVACAAIWTAAIARALFYSRRVQNKKGA